MSEKKPPISSKNADVVVAEGVAQGATQIEHREAPPKSVGRYRILNEVGRGATAFVYKAYDPQLDRFLAIKVLRQKLAADYDYQTAFLREARLAAQLTHPGIVTIYDVGIADDKPYIGMELLEGATLEQILKTQGKLNLRTMLAMSIQISQALAYAHKQGVVHRDIKPGNIMVLKDKKTVKLTDFGIAQLNENLSQVEKRSDKVLGTPEYMAPEQVLGKVMDNRTDLYALGVLIYRALMGLPPFISDDLGELFKQIIKVKPPLLYVSEDKVEDDLQDLVRKLLQKHPQKRYQSAVELTRDLRLIQSKLGAKEKERKSKATSIPMRWTATMAGIVFAAMCVGLTIVYFMQYKALSGITFDYGRSIARMIAFESSEQILLDDMVGLNALVTESGNNEQLNSIYVMNNENVILASTLPQLIGENFVPPDERSLKQSFESSDIYQRQLADETVLFDIAMPIKYADKPLGHLYVSFSADSMYTASKTTLITMLIVMMITLVVVFVITLVLARKTSKDYQRVTQALNKMSLGRVDARLISQRNDEAGQLFAAFNRLASFLENRLEKKHGSIEQTIKTVSVGDIAQPPVEVDETVELDIVSQVEKT